MDVRLVLLSAQDFTPPGGVAGADEAAPECTARTEIQGRALALSFQTQCITCIGLS